jgi:hypothetical protein
MGGMRNLHPRFFHSVRDYNILMNPKPAQIADPIDADAAVKTFAEMTAEEYEQWDKDFIAALWAGDDSASKASLAAGVPIYYAEEDTPPSAVIKKYPDGRKELVTFVDGQESFLRTL